MSDLRVPGQSGKHLLALSFSAFDPKRDLGQTDRTRLEPIQELKELPPACSRSKMRQAGREEVPMPDMTRRDFVIVLAGAIGFWPMGVQAQQRFRVGLLDTGLGARFAVPFTRKLVELGYVEGRNLALERRSAEGNVERLNDLAAELVRDQVDVIVTAGTPAGLAAKKATSTIPIVLGANSDPVGVGLVSSLARPGGNLTGSSLMAPDLSPKRLEILRTLTPGISRVAILWDSSNPGMAARVRETKIAADQAHVVLHVVVHAILKSWMLHLPTF